jgi:hypothetical protein
LKRYVSTLVGLTLLCTIGPGCGSQSSSETTAPGQLGEAGPNQRLRLKEEYKQAIGKDGKMILKPGMKPPAGLSGPKS